MRKKIHTWLDNPHAPGDRLKVAAVTIPIVPQPENNLETIIHQVDAVLQKYPQTELVLFGEMLLGWFHPGQQPAYHLGIARPLSTKFLQPLMERCLHHGIYLCFGMPERDGTDAYNTQILINPQGEIQAVHRKWNLKEEEKLAHYRPGDKSVTSTNIKGFKTGIVICADAAHPKTMWQLIKGRFDLILLSLADDRDQDFFMAKFNARLYDAWVVTANRYGYEDSRYWDGHSVISDPWGSLKTTSKGQAGTLIYDIHRDRDQNFLKRLVRNVVVKASFIVHLLSNLKRIRDYR